MRIIKRSVAVTTVGSAGAALGSGTIDGMMGQLLDVYLDFHADAPGGTTDTTIAYTTRGGNILAVSNSATDALIAPRQKLVDNANAAISDSHALFPMNQGLTVSVAQSDALTACVTAHFRILILD